MKREKLSTEKRREQIAEAALEIAAAHGVKGVTATSVAKRLGLAPSALYRHYKGKEQILEAIADLMGNRLVLLLETSAEDAGDTMGTLEGLLGRIIGMGQKFPALPMVMFSEEIFQRKDGPISRFGMALERYFQKLAQVIAEGQEAGVVTREIQAGQLAVMFVGLYVPPMLLFYSTGGKFDLEGQVMSAWKLFQKAITPAHTE